MFQVRSLVFVSGSQSPIEQGMDSDEGAFNRRVEVVRSQSPIEQGMDSDGGWEA